jgi:hypothetical protein
MMARCHHMYSNEVTIRLSEAVNARTMSTVEF